MHIPKDVEKNQLMQVFLFPIIMEEKKRKKKRFDALKLGQG